MAKVKFQQAFDMASYIPVDSPWKVSFATANTISLQTGISAITYSGSFLLSGNEVTGQVSAIDRYTNGALVYSVTEASADATIMQHHQVASGAADEQQTYAYVLQANDQITGSDANDVILAYSGNDLIFGLNGNDTLDGGTGIDYAAYAERASATSVTNTPSGWVINSESAGQDTLTNIERLQFSDKKVAIDITDNALETLQFLGVIAPALQGNLNVRGTILALFDQGKSMQEMSQLALDLGLITSDNTALAKTVFKNVFNTTSTPDLTLINTLVGFIEQNGDAKFLATVAGLNINVDLVGLQQNGMEFI